MKAEDVMYVLDALGGDGVYKRSGDHIMAKCVHAPWGHDSGTDSGRKLGVLVQQGVALVNCFRPGCFKGTLLDLVSTVGGKRVGLGEMTADELSNLQAFVLMAEEEEVDGDFLKKTVQPIPTEVLAALGQGSPYWRSRGADAKAEGLWKMGEAGGRALFGILDQKGTVVGVQGRLMSGYEADDFPFDRSHDRDLNKANYRTWPVGFDREKYLAGEHLARGSVDFLIIVESPFDAILLNQWLEDLPKSALPFDDATNGVLAVATMGGNVAVQQLQRMIELVSTEGEIAVAMDNDHAGRLAERQVIDQIRLRCPRISTVKWKRKDPSDSDGGKLAPAVVKKDALDAIAVRTDWLVERMKKLLTNVA
jgi:hypothetical protein